MVTCCETSVFRTLRLRYISVPSSHTSSELLDTEPVAIKENKKENKKEHALR